MAFLVATILLNVVVLSILKLFPKHNINAVQATAVNYCACVVVGCLSLWQNPFSKASFDADWFPWAILQGVMFFSLFNLMAYSARHAGMAATAIGAKLSLVIPVAFSVLLYHEVLTPWHIAGILISIPAVILTSTKRGNSTPKHFLPVVLLFVGSGLLDTLINFTQHTYLSRPVAQAACTIIAFSAAGVSGLLYVTVKLARGQQQFQMRNVWAGIVLGIPNFFSIYYYVRTLNTNALQSSAVIPLLNIGILTASTLWAIFFFKEATSLRKVLGIALSVVSIVLIWLGST